MGDFGVYVHIPFCRRKCFYCDFPSYAGEERWMSRYREALCREIAVQGCRCLQAGAVRTVYIGGGTPTVLPAELLTEILRTLIDAAGIPQECTVEANPGTVDVHSLAQLREAGANRLSLGVQSFDDQLLRAIGRIHTAEEARTAFRAARAAGFNNISLDLMYGLPTQTLDDLKTSVNEALALAPEHISAYGLIVEEGTPFAAAEAQGRLTLPSEDAAEEMYDYLMEELPARGYVRYEISNFARAGYESLHNRGYWRNVPYLGVGAAAHGYVDSVRWGNEPDTEKYICAMQTGRSVRTPEDTERTRANAMEEYAFLALRTAQGIDEADFRRTFGVGIDDVYGAVIEKYITQGLLRRADGFVALTNAGMKVGNEVFAAFLH